MDEGGETSTSHQVSPNEVVHAPVTPAKPTQPDPNTIHRNWLESPFDEAIFEETSVKKSFNFWESNLRSTSQIHDTGGMYNKFSVDDAYILNSMSCRDLLALADASIRKGSDNSTQQYGRVDGNNHLSDLNLLPQTIMGVHVSTGLSLQFTPVTANKGRRSEHKQVASDIVNINADERTNPNIEANKRDGSNLDEQSQADGSTLVEANQNLEKGLTEQTNVNETPQPKERRRKHRPKVVKEGQQKRARKPATPKPDGSSTGKRKYVRRKVVEKSTETPVVEEASGTIDLSTEQQTKKSCKRKINFDEPEKQSEVMVEKTQVEQVGAKGCATSEVENCLQGLEHESPSPITPSKTDPPQGRSRKNVKVKCRINFLQENGDIEPSTVPSPNESNCSTSICFSTVEEAQGSKVELSSKLDGIKHLDKDARENSCDLLEAYLSPYTDYNSVSKQGTQLPAVNMNKRHRKNQSVMTADTSASKAPSYKYMQNFNRKKTEAFTMVHGSVPFAGRLDGRYQQHTCTEAYTADFHVGIATKKKTMKTSTVPSWYNDHPYSTTHIGSNPSLRCISTHDVDALINQFELLNINRQMVEENRNAVVPFMSGYHVPYMSGYHEKNALVVYQQNGRLVPYEGVFNPVKRRKPRPKVDLDDETSRVWMLLLEDINSEGIDGTDEAKAKWWEEERRVFRGRADSFIARMHLVQGDRRFSRWKGSVLDSVVGVFLTQNVSDHLSSSAFMSLAARYPLKSNNSSEAPHEEESILSVKEPWQEDEDCGSMNLQDAYSCEEKETANELSKNSGSTVDLNDNSECEVLELSEKESAVDDILSSQNSTYTSPSSVQSSVDHITERLGSCSKHNFGEQKDGSKSNVHDGCTSFVELLHMQGTTVVNKTHSQRQADDSSEQTLPTKEYELPNTCSLGALEVGSFELREEREIIQMKNEKSASVESGLSAESASQTTVQMVKTISSQESVKSCSTCNNCEVQEVFDITHVSAETSKSTKINKIVEASGETVHRVVEFNLNTSRNDQIVDGMAEDSSKIKKVKTGKEQIKVDWDNLRLHAEVKQKRERTPDTMDSLDYEAVRAADVDEVADSIKERGMNNRLAARIKDMLDRLVRDHGSIDLEWLRDVPPDKAKEYLLSFKGLGLKSVECIRLLTLHHLAFPVDTNVGRIAVRLGWVPLQPLPESLQLHLLELYPVQETIQKYLWPRLCKLDQRTLYELHYQMITFGKVFCTKTKPNCNACPLRGECRHFASAFASARLGLPAPEESLPILTRNRTGQSPVGMIDLPPASEQLQPPSEVQNCNPVIVEPATSGPTIEVPATPGPIVKISASAEPIVEVPASPEPEQIQQASDIEDFCEDSEEIPMIKLNIEQFTQNLQTYMERHMELGEGDMSKALVAITSEAASIPTPKLKNVSQLRTEHQVYELPDSHPLLEGLDTREPDDPCPYLLAIWIPGETADSIQPPEGQCCSQESGILCNEETCFFCNSTREANFQTVRGTLLIPCRTAMRGSFPLNGTYFQVNEVFADHTSSLNPIDVPRSWLWNLPRRTVYFGTSIPTIFKGMTTEAIQYCFWRGFVCVRGFDQETRAPRPLMARLHFPASRLKRSKAKTDEKRG